MAIHTKANKKSIDQLKNERAKCFARAEGILDETDEEGRDLTSSEKRQYESEVASIERLTRQIELAAKAEKQQIQGMQGMSGGDGSFAPIGGDRPTGSITSPLGVKLQAFQNTPQGRQDAYASARWLAAVIHQDESSQRWCSERGLFDTNQVLMAHSSSNAAGGVLIPEIFSASVIRLVEEHSIARQSSRVIPMGGGDTLHMPRRDSGLTASFVGELVEGTESDSTWSDIQLTPKKAMILTRVSSELSDDSAPAIVDQLALDMALSFSELEDTCLLVGNGTSEHGGMQGAFPKSIDGTHSNAVQAAASGHQLLNEPDADDLINMLSKLPMYAKRLGSCAWYTSPTGLDVIFRAIQIAGGGTTPEQLAAAMHPTFLGYPIRVSPLLPDSVTTDYADTYMLGIGDLSLASTMAVRRDLRIAASDAPYFTSDAIALKASERFVCNVHELGDSDSKKSPFVVLVGTA